MKPILCFLLAILFCVACSPITAPASTPTPSKVVVQRPTETSTPATALPSYEIEGKLQTYPESDSWYFVGSIRNNTDQPLLSANIHFTIKRNQMDASEITLYEHQFGPIPPHELEYIDTGIISRDPELLSVYAVALENIQYGEAYQSVQLEFEDVREQNDQYTESISGFVRNTGSETILIKTIKATLFDSADTPIGVMNGLFTPFTTLESGESTPFFIVANVQGEKYSSYKLSYTASTTTENLMLKQPDELEFSDWNYFQDVDNGYFHLVGRVTNHSPNTIAIHPGFALLNKDRHVLSFNVGDDFPGILLPGETALVASDNWYYSPLKDPQDEISQVLGFASLAAIYSSSETFDLQISGVKFYHEQTPLGKQLIIRGNVYNPQTEALSSCNLLVEIYGLSTGKIWGAGGINFQDGIGGKSSVPFSIQLPFPKNMDISQFSYRVKSRCIKLH